MGEGGLCLQIEQRGKRREWMTADTCKAIDSRHILKKKLIDAKSERLRERYQQRYSEKDQQINA